MSLGNQNTLAAQSSTANNPYIRNNRYFSGLYLALQILMIVMYAIFLRPTGYAMQNATDDSKSYIDSGLINATGAGLLVLIGFGLYFSYLRNLSFSGLGFTFLITVITFQLYMLLNAFWTKANVQMNGDYHTNVYQFVFLSDQGGSVFGASAVEAFKCSLSLSIAFAGIGGRAGPFEAIIIVIIGTVLYELNRQILTLFSVDYGGSMSLFLFGGIFGTILSLLLKTCRQKQEYSNHKNYKSSKNHVTLCLLGTAFCWVFFPTINMNLPQNLFIVTNGGISTFYCISSAVVTSIGFSLFINGKLYYRDLITGTIAGGVIVGSSSIYIYNPMQAIILGIFAGILQVVFNKIEMNLGNSPLWNNGIFFLFAVQGFLGGLASAIIRAINQTYSTNSYNTAYNNLGVKAAYYGANDQRGQISGTFISLGIGIGAGLLTFLWINFVNKQQREAYYHDKTYWNVGDDGISTYIKEQEIIVSVQLGSEIKGEHAYL